AQPLYVPFLQITGKGVHNAVIVCTMKSWVYAFDADDAAGANAAPLWARQLDPRPVPAHVFGTGYNDIADSDGGTIGILSTPAIEAKLGTGPADPTTGTMYLVLATWDPAQADGAFRQLLFAINLADGQPRPAAPGQANPVAVAGDFPGAGYATAA